MNPDNRVLRFALIAVPLLFLLTVVAIASQAGFGSAKSAAPNNDYVSYAMSVFFVLFVLMIPVAIWSYFQRTPDMSSQRISPGRRAARMLIAVTLAGVSVFVWRWLHSNFSLPSISLLHHGPAHNAPHQKFGKSGPGHAAQPHFEWTVLWVALAAGVGLVGWWLYIRATRPPEEARTAPLLEDDLTATIDDAIETLENERNPRVAVIAAYARMERVLGRHGFARKGSETAIEYLRRVLLGVTVNGAAVERLTELFELAKFSRHDVTGAMKDEAIASLREIRDGIAT